MVAAVVPSAPPASAAPIAGMIVFLDPGHSGSGDPAALSRQVPNGRGGTKNCQTSGTATNSGYPEHSFTWDTTLRIRQALTSAGVRTAMSRGDDTGPAPCVDARATAANALHPNAIVSIHADGGPANGHGFHVNYSAPPLNSAQEGPAVRLAQVMAGQLQAAGIPPANYIGTDGLKGRADLAGLNLAEYPSVLVELGNMKNATDAALMESPAGRQRYADAVARGVIGYLSSQTLVP
ncbi:Rv3717 family N-acetylmuramoyl-L-alanine amidase [Mycolicibacter arupensis]|uniref:N-acetylmuramoyl-L-alanine amidase n=1 Tax=Mycolicibacter arupensis TaxID=342002 RepID=A0A0F5MUY6_9MYCO|nr:Rv3717 family N-acetylmuramoyl-L-alanine amidase [Mycolicibacter arupensis]KKB98633.1 N-acetylmuramoyl-L-alanine amidase [Mycolicibacter arupensis]MCV7275112.1 Rv3717 family N-acetylmuramoyl-L-alanine amidase [Mycolicibacter arupensis]OQZ97842.1 N-acetylmuramoyl-L-alanine amidase [Mycolicibacter arupensis]